MKHGVEESDKHIIRQAMQGETDAFTQLVQNYKNYVYQTAFGILTDRTEAEDVAQDTFIRAFHALPTLRQPETFPSWIATIATRLALDTLRRRKREVPMDAPETDLRAEHTPDAFVQVEQRLDLQRMLEALSDEERTVMVLRELHDKAYAEIAATLNIPIGTVRSRLHSARRHLQQVMRRKEDG